jgi:hypothetical protein
MLALLTEMREVGSSKAHFSRLSPLEATVMLTLGSELREMG